MGLCSALLSAPLIWGLARRGYVRRGAQLGAFWRALGGLHGIVVMHFICPDLDARHATVWHGLVGALRLVGGLLLGAVAGRKRIH